ncbi:hypothetical protein MesoLjLc_10300 [Mesorhizobium sp. L-8-10]|nr:hypothetical protein MesoLjLb_10430 [Mesorhizobium sp. L-8-3]BCH29100.1 hypothetical protein MesoLjLc_10300 [Mesorhizobium sp. L-8-10]
MPEAANNPQPLREEAVYRIDAGGKTAMVADQPFKANGLRFSNDCKRFPTPATGTVRRRRTSSGCSTSMETG